MATKLTSRGSDGDKPSIKRAPAKGAAPGKKDAANSPPAPAEARRAIGAKKAPRPRKGTVVNAETAEVLRDAEAGKNLLHYPSLEAMFEDLGI
jgi:hypothetical protein